MNSEHINTAYNRSGWFYYDTPIGGFIPEEEVQFLPAKQEGGTVMDP
ncbi:hypothetical protein [Parapedobacter tibetensis]|nr:hypothetical protein [Parapedobacter tibetensis]